MIVTASSPILLVGSYGWMPAVKSGKAEGGAA